LLWIFLCSLLFFLYTIFKSDFLFLKIQAQEENTPQNLSQELESWGILPLIQNNTSEEDKKTKQNKSEDIKQETTSIFDFFRKIQENLEKKDNWWWQDKEKTNEWQNQTKWNNNKTTKEEKIKENISTWDNKLTWDIYLTWINNLIWSWQSNWKSQNSWNKKQTNQILEDTLKHIIEQYYSWENSYLNEDICSYSNSDIVYINWWINSIPENISWNTIYVLNSGDYILDYMINITENCTAIIGLSWTTTFYTTKYLGATIKIVSWTNNIIENIILEWKLDWSWSTHTGNNYWIYISTTGNIINNIKNYDQTRFAIYMDDFDNTIINSNFYKTDIESEYPINQKSDSILENQSESWNTSENIKLEEYEIDTTWEINNEISKKTEKDNIKEEKTINKEQEKILALLEKKVKETEITQKKDTRVKKEFSATNHPVKLKSQKEVVEPELVWKLFDKEENKYRGKSSLDLSESEWKLIVPTILESVDEKIKVEIPEWTIFKNKHGQKYTWVVLAPKKTNQVWFKYSWSNIQSAVSFKVGSLTEEIQLKDIEDNAVDAKIEMELTWYKSWDMIPIYTSQDWEDWEYLWFFDVIEKDWKTIIDLETNHFSYISAGTHYWNYFKWSIQVTENFLSLNPLACHARINWWIWQTTIMGMNWECGWGRSNTYWFSIQFRLTESSWFDPIDPREPIQLWDWDIWTLNTTTYQYWSNDTYYYDATAPTSSISPNWSTCSKWMAFSFWCSDAWVWCTTVYYKTIDWWMRCTDSWLSSTSPWNGVWVAMPSWFEWTKKVCYKWVDRLGNSETIKTSNNFNIDNWQSAPSPTYPSAGWYVNTTKPTLTRNSNNLWCSSMDWYTVLFYYSTNCSTTPNVNWVTTESFTTSTLSNWSSYSWRVQGKDNLWNTSDLSTCRSFTVDTTLPTITINNPSTSPATFKTITASTNEGTLTMTAWSTSTTCNWTRTFVTYSSTTFSSEADNGKYVCYRAVDAAGNIRYSLSNAIAGIDRTAPSWGSFTINWGATHTKSTAVTLNINCPTDAWTPIQVAYGNSASPTNRTSCTSSISHTLTSTNWSKTVYMRFRDGWNNTTSDISQPIILDTTAPTYVWYSNISWHSHVNWSDYWFKAWSELWIDITHSDNIKVYRQYFWFNSWWCSPNGCWWAPNEIKSYNTNNSHTDRWWFVDDNHIDIYSSDCIDSDWSCTDNDLTRKRKSSIKSTISEGDYRLNTYLYDAAMNWVWYTNLWIWIKIDKTNPTSTITSPSAWSRQNWSFNVSISDTDARSWIWTCRYRILDNWTQSLWWTSRTCNSTITINQSSYCSTQWTNKCTIESYSIDNVGNTSSTVSRSFSIDTISPSPPTCTTSRHSSSTSLSVSCSTSEWTIKFTTNWTNPTCSSSTWSNRSFSATTDLKVAVCDAAWNLSIINAYKYIKDTTNPSWTYTLDPNTITNTNVNITVNPTDNFWVKSIQLPNNNIITWWVLPTLINPNTRVIWTNWSQPWFWLNWSTTENKIILKENPRNIVDKVWASEQNDSTSDADWWWNSDTFSIDKTKKYRSVVWIRRENTGNWRTYFGTLWSHVNNLNWTVNTNPYFRSFLVSDVPQIKDNRLLLVWHIHPYTYSSTSSDPESGIYNIYWDKVANMTDFKRTSTATLSRHRTYLYYSTSTTERQYRYRPRFEVVDGNEPSIQDLLQWKETANSIDYEVTWNWTYNFTIKDRADNSFAIAASVTNIDKTAPTLSANNSSTSWKTSNISITLSVSDTNLNISKYRWNNSDCRNWTNFTNWNIITQSTDWSHTLYLCANDSAWNTKTWNWTYKLDKTNPTVSASPAWWSFSSNITITLYWADNLSLAYSKYSWISAADCLSNGTSYSNGSTITKTSEWTQTLYLCVWDSAWRTNTASYSFTRDTTAPTGAPSCTANAYFSSSLAVTCTAWAWWTVVKYTTNGSNPIASSSIWSNQSFSSTTTLKAISCDALNNCNTSSITSRIYTKDTNAPSWGSFTINWGATHTKSTAVTLNVTCPTDAWTPIQVAYGNSASPTNRTSCTSSISHTLTSTDWPKTVYMRFRDGWNNTTSDTTKNIILDTIAPTTTDNANSTRRSSDFSVTLTPNETSTTRYCIGTSSCSPTTIGTTANVTCTAGSTCSSQYVRYYSTDTAGNAESIKTSAQIRIDKQVPTFTFLSNFWPECTAGTLSITSASDAGAWLHSSPYSFNWSTWNTTTSTSITAQQPWTQNRTAYVRDSLGNSSSKNAIYTFTNVAPTANNFVGHSSVGNTPRTVNWKTLSSATEGFCGNSSITYNTIVTQWTKGTCSVVGDNITYTPNTSHAWSDSCVIQLKDNENSTVNITASWNGIDTTAPTSAPTCTDSAYFSWSITVNCTVWEGWTQIRYTTGWVDPSPSSPIWSNQSFSSTTTLKTISCDALNNCNLTAVTTKTYTLDNLAPTSTISDTNSNRRNTNISTTLNWTDAGVWWVTTFYKTIAWYDQTCTAGWYSKYSSAISITANIWEVNQQTLCYYSTDNLWNTETTKKQNYRIDKSDPAVSAPAIYLGTYFGNYYKWTINLRSSISDIWAWILEWSCMRNMNNTTWQTFSVSQTPTYCIVSWINPNINFNIKFLVKDQANNTGISNQSDFIYDNTAPTIGTPDIYAGTTHNNAYFKWTISIQATATDAWSNINTNTCEYSLNNGTSRSAASFAWWFCQITNISPTNNLQILIRAKDNLWTTGTSLSKTYTYDNTPPTTTDNATSTRTKTDQIISLSANDAWAGLANTYYCITTSWWTCIPNILGTSILITGNNNEITSKQIRYYSTDNLNTDESIKTSPVINIDKQAPTGWSFSINNNAEKTNTKNVELTIQCPTDLGISEVEVAYGNGGGRDGDGIRIGDPISNRQRCSESLALQLSGDDWIKTVYMLFRDTLWNITNHITDTIELDRATRSTITNKIDFKERYGYWERLDLNIIDENRIDWWCFFNVYKYANQIIVQEPRLCNIPISFYSNEFCNHGEICYTEIEVFSAYTEENNTEWLNELITVYWISDTVSFMVDNAAPVTTDNSITRSSGDQTITLFPTDLWTWVANTYYCITTSGWTCMPNITWTNIVITWASNSITSKQIKYYSIDNLDNNESINTSLVINIDKQTPSIELIWPENNSAFDEEEQIILTWSGTDENGIGMSGYLYEIYNSNNQKVLSWTTVNTWIMVSWLTEDTYTRRIIAYDLLYNESVSSTGNFIVQSSAFVVIPNTSNSWTIQTAFTNKEYELIDNKLLGYKPINLKYSNTICPDIPVQIFSSWTTIEETIQIEFPWCFKVKTNNIAFTGTIEAPTIQNQTSAFSLINNTKDAVIFAWLSGQKIDFVNQSDDPTKVKIYIPSPTRDLNTIMDVYYSQNGTQWNYFWTGEVTTYSGQKYTIIETTHFTYFTIGTTTGNFVINNDETSTLSRNVTLHMNVQWATHMKFWHSTGDVESASWIAYNPTYNRELTEWTGTKTVYAMFTNGTDTGYVNDTIVFIIDTQWPTQANIYSPWNNSNIFLGNTSIKWTTSLDTITGLSGYVLQISKDNFSSVEKQFSTTYTDYTESFINTGIYQLRILSIDNAGNTTTGNSIQINVQDNIIEYYFGSGSKFTENRQANNCNTGDIGIVYVYNYSGYGYFPYTSLWSNKIYILQEGTHIANNQITFNGNCIALVWENPYQGEQKTTLYSNTQLTNAIYAYQKNNIIVDNLQLDGTKNWLGGSHTINSNGINRNQTTSTTLNNFSVSLFWTYGIYYNGNNYWIINNVNTYKNNYWFYLESSINNQIENIQTFNNTIGMRLNYSNTNTYNNSKFFNNTNYWMYLWSSSYNIFNNSIFHNNNIGISANEVWYNYLFNSIISQNALRWVEMNWNSYITTMNTSILWNQNKDIFRDTRAGIFKYYGYLKTNTIENNTLTTGWNELLGIGISSGYIIYDNNNSYNEKINIKNQSGINLYNWTNPIYWRNTNRDFISWTFSFGKNIPTKEQPIKRSGTSLTRYSLQFTNTSTDEFIASNTKKVIITDIINKQITTGDNQRILILSWNNSFYTITGNISEETWGTITSTKNIPIILSWGEEKKRIITQTRKEWTNWVTHYETISIIDTTPPTTPQNVFVKNITATTGITIERSPSIDSWAGISWYIYQISTASDFSNIQQYGTTQQTTTTIEWLQETTQYYVRIKAIDNVGYESSWNENLSFTISEEIENLVTDFYFGSGNIFTRTWSSQCDPSQIQIIKVPNYQNLGNNIFPYTTLNENTIYVLEEGIHILGNTVTFNGECSALVGKGTKDNILWKVELYSNAILTNMIAINGNKRIIDNIIVDWTNNGIWWTHSVNNYWIIASSVSSNSIFNTTVKNTYSANIQIINSTNNKIKNTNIYNIWNNVYGIQLNNADGNTIEHINMYNNSYNAIVLENWSNNNIINNVNVFNNNNVVSNWIYWILVRTNSSYNTINNCIVNNNGNFGIRLWSDYNTVNNCIVNNNEQYGIIVTSNNNILSDIIAINNVGADIFTDTTTTKFYDNIETHKIQTTNFLIGGNELLNIWLSTGNIQLRTSKDISWNDMINVVNNDNNKYLSPRTNIFRGRNTTRTTTWDNIEFSLGQNILLQKPILYYSWTTLQTLTWTEIIERNPTKFIGTKTTKIDVTTSIDKLYTSTADTARTITIQYPWTVSYIITWDITQTYSWILNNETGINVTLSWSTEWMRNIIIQTRTTSWNKNHSHIKTYLDNNNPTKPTTWNISRVSSNNDIIEIFWNKWYDNGSEISWYYYEISLDNSFSILIQTWFTEYNTIQITWLSWYQEIFTRIKTIDTTNKESDWIIIGGMISNIKNQNEIIITKYFSPQNYYTKNRNSYWCTNTGETRVFVLEPEGTQDFFFWHLNENSIYILKEWTYNINDSISFERWCTVVAKQENTSKVRIVSSKRLPSLISLIMTNNNIIENLFLNGEIDKNGITHTRNNANIYTIGANNNSLYGLETMWWWNSIYFYSNSSYNSLENIICYKNTYCSYIYWWGNYNTFNNIIMHNNYHGIHIRWPWYNTFNNMLSFNNDSWIWFSSSHNRNVISNSVFANNRAYWISSTDWAAGTFDVLSNVSFINNWSMDLYTTSNSFFKYYNVATWITIPNNASQGWSEFSYLWWIGGQKTNTNTNELFNSSINILGNRYLRPWWNITRWPIVTWIYSDTMTTSFGKNIPTQTQPVRRSWSTLIYYWTTGLDWNPDYFIWSTTIPTRIQVEIDKPISDSSDISRTIILSWQGILNYSISWNLTTNPSWSFTDSTSIPITLSSSTDGAKNIIVQIRTGTNNPTHYQPVTFVDSAPPTTPLPIQPLQGYTGYANFVTANIDFEWSASTDEGIGMSWYVLEISTGSNFSTILYRSTGYTTTKTVALKEGSYYWRVKAFDNALKYSLYSAVWPFYVDTTFTQEYDTPSTPTILYPNNKTITNTSWINIIWTTSIDTGIWLSGYIYQISTDTEFTNIILSWSTTITGEYINNLNDNKYFLRIAAVDYLDNISNFSAYNEFTIDTINPSIVFTWVTPVNNEIITNNTLLATAEITEANLNTLLRNRNGINYPIYDSWLILMMNFDNRTNLGETTWWIIKDFSQYENHGVNYYGSTRTNNWKYWWSYLFDWRDDHIQVNNIPWITDDLTISLRIKPTYDWITRGFLVKGNQWTQQNNEYGLRGGSSNNLYHFFIANEYNRWQPWAVLDDLTFTIPPEKKNQRVHLTASTSKQNNTLTVYLDWKLVAEGERTVENIGASKNRELFIGQWYSWSVSFSWSLRSWYIDEVRIYNRALSSWEIKTLYETNLAKIDENKRQLETQQQCLPDWNYSYEITATDKNNNTANTGRNFTIQLPELTAWTPLYWLNITWFTSSTTTQSWEYHFTWEENTFRIYDTKWYTWWYTTIRLSGDLTNPNWTLSIWQENIQFKANNDIITIDWSPSSWIWLASWITEYKPMTGSYTYITKEPTPECSSCIVGKYWNNPSLKVTIPAMQKADTYNWTLIFTLYN